MKKYYKLVSVMLIMITLCGMSLTLSGCKDYGVIENGRQVIDLEVINPVTGKPIERSQLVIIPYSEEVNIPDVKLRVKGTNDYLLDEYSMDKEFQDNEMLHYVTLSVAEEGGGAYKQRAWKEWPTEVGRYGIIILFNFNGKPYEEYTEDKLKFSLIISEEE